MMSRQELLTVMMTIVNGLIFFSDQHGISAEGMEKPFVVVSTCVGVQQGGKRGISSIAPARSSLGPLAAAPLQTC